MAASEVAVKFRDTQLAVQGNENNPEVVLLALEALLKATKDAQWEDLTTVDANGQALSSSIAGFIRATATSFTNVRHVLLLHLAQIPDPLPFIEILPSLFCMSTSSKLIDEVVAQFEGQFVVKK